MLQFLNCVGFFEQGFSKEVHRGIQKMIDEGQYCIDILNQIKAVKNSITTFDKYFNNSDNRISDKLMILYRSKFFLPCS